MDLNKADQTNFFGITTVLVTMGVCLLWLTVKVVATFWLVVVSLGDV